MRASGFLAPFVVLATVGAAVAAAAPFAVSRVLVVFEEGFPTVDAPPLSRAQLDEAFAPLGVEFVGVEGFAEALEKGGFGLVVFPHGSAFPKALWLPLLAHLEGGGSLLVPGGAPFAVPVRRAGEGWKVEVPQPAYARELRIGPPEVAVGKGAALGAASVAKVESDSGFECDAKAIARAERVFAFDLRFTDRKDFEKEDGSAGPRDALVRPLLLARSKSGRSVASLAIEVDRLRGRFAGGRWIFAPFDGPRSPELLRALAERALEGPREFVARPGLACYRPGEAATIRLEYRRPLRAKWGAIVSDGPAGPTAARVVLEDAGGAPLEEAEVSLSGSGSLRFAETRFSRTDLAPGLYRVRASLSESGDRASTGFWILDENLLRSGDPIVRRGELFERGGRPFPFVGMTTMASDVTRKFLFEPNPALWDEDMAAMRGAGVALLRTGLWTAWKTAMLDPGAPSETFLRSLDAFVLTAARNDLPAIFTCFAFLPEAWGGENPYLDPRAVAAQREFVSAVARRYAGSPWVLYDLINEPSFDAAPHLWKARPNGDPHEAGAWEAWLADRHGAEATDEVLERFRVTPKVGAGIPSVESFDPWRRALAEATPRKAAAFARFAQDRFEAWALAMREAIEAAAGPGTLVTVGQDEGGLADRPNPHLHARAVDFTCIHTWWNNDDLLWDGVAAKVRGLPMVVEETGVMLEEDSDGRNRRSPAAVRDLFERKLALAFAGRAAGVIPWVWSADPYMPSDNEASIGLHRADGTAKPEFAIVPSFAGFLKRNRDRFVGLEPDPVVVLLPHAGQYLPRSLALDASRRSVRVLGYRLGIGVESASDLAPRDLSAPLVVVPSPGQIATAGWEALVAAVEEGATALVSGPFDADEDGLPAGRYEALGISATARPLAREEALRAGDRLLDVSFGGFKVERLDKLDFGDPEPKVVEVPQGKGRFLLCPLPLENADEADATEALYAFALERAGVAPPFRVEPRDRGVLVRALLYRDAALYVFVNERDREATLSVAHGEAPAAPFEARIPAGGATLAFVDRRTGRVLDRYERADL